MLTSGSDDFLTPDWIVFGYMKRRKELSPSIKFTPFSCCFIEDYLLEWRKHMLIEQKNRKRGIENAITAYGHVKAVILYMMAGHQTGHDFWTWRFLLNWDHMEKYVLYLSETNNIISS